MPNTGNLYALGMKALLTGGSQLIGRTLKLALVGAGYTPNLASDQYWSVPQISEFSGAGYSPGGNVLTGAAVNVFTAPLWSQSYPSSGVPVTAGEVIKSGNFLYRAANPGIAASPPSFPQVEGQTVTDSSGIIWTNVGNMILVFTVTGGFSWSLISTSNVPYAVIYDSTSGSPAASPLLILLTFSPAMTNIPAGPVTVSPDPALGYLALPLF